jgi:hypothetical protein
MSRYRAPAVSSRRARTAGGTTTHGGYLSEADSQLVIIHLFVMIPRPTKCSTKLGVSMEHVLQNVLRLSRRLRYTIRN